jgi:methoxymalonate biosynthesis acyl carrier protein
MPTKDEIKADVRDFLAKNVSADNITDDTSLIKGRIVDSIIALKLVSHLEDKFNIEFAAHEVDQDNLDSISIIANFVESKLK